MSETKIEITGIWCEIALLKLYQLVDERLRIENLRYENEIIKRFQRLRVEISGSWCEIALHRVSEFK